MRRPSTTPRPGGRPASRADTRVVVAEDQRLVGDVLVRALSVEGYDARALSLTDEDETETTQVGAAGRSTPMPRAGSAPASRVASEGASRIVASRPRIVLLAADLDRSDDAVHLIRPLADAGIDVVVLTSTLDREAWGEALQRGARTVLAKTGSLAGLLGVVRRLTLGQRVLDVRDREALIKLSIRRRAELDEGRRRMGLLSARESAVLADLMSGRGVQEVAARDGVCEATVRTQVKSILSKLGVSSQIAAVGLAFRLHWNPSTTSAELAG